MRHQSAVNVARSACQLHLMHDNRRSPKPANISIPWLTRLHSLASTSNHLLSSDTLLALISRCSELALPSVHECEDVKATQVALDEAISRTISAAPVRNERPKDEAFVKYDHGNPKPVEPLLNRIDPH
jgi:hypothetical protein